MLPLSPCLYASGRPLLPTTSRIMESIFRRVAMEPKEFSIQDSRGQEGGKLVTEALEASFSTSGRDPLSCPLFSSQPTSSQAFTRADDGEWSGS